MASLYEPMYEKMFYIFYQYGVVYSKKLLVWKYLRNNKTKFKNLNLNSKF